MGGRSLDQFHSRQQARNKNLNHAKDPSQKDTDNEQDKHRDTPKDPNET